MKSGTTILHVGIDVHNDSIAVSIGRELSLRTPGADNQKPERFSPPALSTQPTANVLTLPREVFGGGVFTDQESRPQLRI